MPWLKETIDQVRNKMDEGVRKKKEEIKQEETIKKLSSLQERNEFPSDEKIEEWLSGYKKEVDIYTLLSILIENGLTTQEEYYEKKKELEDDLRREIKREIMDDLQRQSR